MILATPGILIIPEIGAALRRDLLSEVRKVEIGGNILKSSWSNSF